MFNVKNLIVFGACFLVAVFSTIAGTYIDSSTRQASELAKNYVLADEQGKAQVLDKIAVLVKNNPDNINVVRIYASMLTSHRDYKKAINAFSQFSHWRGASELTLQECMLKDRLGDYEPACYKSAQSFAKRSAHPGVDLLTILYLTGSKDFDKEKARYLSVTGDRQVEDYYDIDKADFLKKLFPDE